MAKPVRVDTEARREIREAAGWYEARRDGLGVEFLGAVDDAIGRAARLGPECRTAFGVPPEFGVRRVLVKRFPYVVYFAELPASVRIIAVGHERRQPGFWRGRIGG